MSQTKTKYSTCAVYKEKISKRTGEKFRQLVGFLSSKDEERGIDIQLDNLGYIIVAL